MKSCTNRCDLLHRSIVFVEKSDGEYFQAPWEPRKIAAKEAPAELRRLPFIFLVEENGDFAECSVPNKKYKRATQEKHYRSTKVRPTKKQLDFTNYAFKYIRRGCFISI